MKETWKGPFFDLLFVTGDIADNSKIRGRHEELASVFKWAQSYLTKLCEGLQIDPEKGLFVIPGNHDVRWSGLLGSKADVELFKNKFARYMRHVFYPEMKLLVACFDSNCVKNFYESAHGLVRMEDFTPLSEGITGESAKPEVLKIALVHHHPLPVSGAEVDTPEAWYEQIMRRKLVGLPQSMVLLNSGTFLQRLLDLDFRLVLHGHLHHRGYWRAHNMAVDGREGWLEVISVGSMGSPPINKPHSFGVITIHRDGLIECQHDGFDTAGNAEPTHHFPTAPYSLVRDRGRRHLTDDIQPIHCRTYVKNWQVDFSTAGLVTLDDFRGFSGIGDKPVSDFYLSTRAVGLTAGQIRVVEHSSNVSVAVNVQDEINPPAAAAGAAPASLAPHAPVKFYRSEFKPPLTSNREIDVKYRRFSEGVVYRSAEDKRCMGDLSASDTDSLELNLDFPAEHLLIRVQFVSDVPYAGKTPWLPGDLALVVLDDSGTPHYRESDNDHVALDFSGAASVPGDNAARTAEAVLSVYRPRLGFTYGITWKLPENEQIQQNEDLIDLRRHLLAPVGPADPRHKADTFAQQAKIAFNNVLAPSKADPELHAYLYAFDSGLNELFCRGTTASIADPLVTLAFRYGRDIIGTAFRRREPMGYLRDEKPEEIKAGLRVFDRFPHEKIAAAIALPIKAPDKNGWPVGIVLFATRSPTGPLPGLLKDSDTVWKLFESVQKLWLEQQKTLCPMT